MQFEHGGQPQRLARSDAEVDESPTIVNVTKAQGTHPLLRSEASVQNGERGLQKARAAAFVPNGARSCSPQSTASSLPLRTPSLHDGQGAQTPPQSTCSDRGETLQHPHNSTSTSTNAFRYCTVPHRQLPSVEQPIETEVVALRLALAGAVHTPFPPILHPVVAGRAGHAARATAVPAVLVAVLEACKHPQSSMRLLHRGKWCEMTAVSANTGAYRRGSRPDAWPQTAAAVPALQTRGPCLPG